MFLTEMPWFSVRLSIPTVSGRFVDIDAIDVRLEDMKAEGVRIKDFYEWLAPLPNPNAGSGAVDRFLTHDHGVVDADRAEQFRRLGWWVMPDNWWEYALGTREGVIVKSPKRRRPGEPSQEEADQQATNSGNQDREVGPAGGQREGPEGLEGGRGLSMGADSPSSISGVREGKGDRSGRPSIDGTGSGGSGTGGRQMTESYQVKLHKIFDVPVKLHKVFNIPARSGNA